MSEPWWSGVPTNVAGQNAPTPASAPWAPPPGTVPQQTSSGQHSAGQPAQWQQSPQTAPRAGAPTQVFGTPFGGPATPADSPQRSGNAPLGAGPVGPQVAAPQGPPKPTVPGLGFAGFLLFVATITFGYFVMRDWVVDWVQGLDSCDASADGWSCVVNDTTRLQILVPTLAILAAWSLIRGAGVERAQGRAVGFIYILLGFAALLAAWVIGGGL